MVSKLLALFLSITELDAFHYFRDWKDGWGGYAQPAKAEAYPSRYLRVSAQASSQPECDSDHEAACYDDSLLSQLFSDIAGHA